MSQGTGRNFAWLWQDGRTTRLNDVVAQELELDLDGPVVINSHGQIACDGVDPDGALVAVLTPVTDRPGDATLDCRVDMADVLRVLVAWGACESCLEDLNGDEIVDAADLLVLFADWG